MEYTQYQVHKLFISKVIVKKTYLLSIFFSKCGIKMQKNPLIFKMVIYIFCQQLYFYVCGLRILDMYTWLTLLTTILHI